MIITLSIIGYLVIGVIVGSMVYWLDSDPAGDDDTPVVALIFCVFWPIALVAAAVFGGGIGLVRLMEWLAGLPQRKKRKAVERRDAIRDMWRQELKDAPPGSARYFVAAEFLKLYEEA